MKCVIINRGDVFPLIYFRTFIEDQSHLALPDQSTVVAEVMRWMPQHMKDTVFHVYDLGGQRSYRSVSYCFQMNSPSSVCLLVHKITSTDYQSTLEWLRMIQISAPKRKIIVALTQMDKLHNKNEKIQQLNDFRT